jgi:predicted nucleotide-binding protein (sugar kinase/HSP70/actin superfamily)
MKLKNLLVSGCVCATMAAFPAMAAISPARGCAVGQVTPASYTWNFQKETDAVFQDIQSDAQQVLTRAANLQSVAVVLDYSWYTDSGELTQLKDLINDMGHKLCRLETIRRVDTPWQQKTIDHIATTLRLMADNTTDAILFGNQNQHELWLPTYQKYVNNLYAQAHSLTQSVEQAVKYAQVQKQEQYLRKDLGIKTSS